MLQLKMMLKNLLMKSHKAAKFRMQMRHFIMQSGLMIGWLGKKGIVLEQNNQKLTKNLPN